MIMSGEMNKTSNIVETEDDAYRRETPYSLLHPEKLVLVDDVGENISQKGDGNAGGHKFMVLASDTRPGPKLFQGQYCCGCLDSQQGTVNRSCAQSS
jgi:hypothetical protein